MHILSIQHLVDAINHWCEEHRIVPVNGQASQRLTERNVRYYRTRNLLDPPGDGSNGMVKRGFSTKHVAQLKAIRLLQARGLPLTLIEQQICGRSIEELEAIECRELSLTVPTKVVFPQNGDTFGVANPSLGKGGQVAKSAKLRAVNDSGDTNQNLDSASYYEEPAFGLGRAAQAFKGISPAKQESWRVCSLGNDFLLVSRKGMVISEDQRRLLSAMLNACVNNHIPDPNSSRPAA